MSAAKTLSNTQPGTTSLSVRSSIGANPPQAVPASLGTKRSQSARQAPQIAGSRPEPSTTFLDALVRPEREYRSEQALPTLFDDVGSVSDPQQTLSCVLCPVPFTTDFSFSLTAYGLA